METIVRALRFCLPLVLASVLVSPSPARATGLASPSPRGEGRGEGLPLPCPCANTPSSAPPTTSSLAWSKDRGTLSADLSSARITDVLERIAATTGWQVFLEPDAAGKLVSAKFKNLSPGDALRLLLRDLNFALLPDSQSGSRLFVFQTARENATQRITPVEAKKGGARKIPNELIVRLKPGVKIDDLARLLGAKVTGRLDALNTYRLEFPDAQAADAAREQLAKNAEVTGVDNNYAIDKPITTPRDVSATTVGPPNLQLKPPGEGGPIIVGLIDTGVQSLGPELDKFLLKGISVAGQSQLDPAMPSHGTSMAETILRGLEASSPGGTSVQILPIDVYGPGGETSTYSVAAGIIQAVNNGARIVNLSLGSEGDSPFLRSIIQDASSRGILFIGAAGNTPVTTPTYPAAYPEVMAVTATDGNQIASYANRGPFVALAAPGGSVVYYNNQPYYVVGTSSATALVSGIAAGFMDSNKASAPNTQMFLKNNFGLRRGN